MAGRGFRYFVLFAGMRTGSNFLAQNLAQFPDLGAYGELFNPHFVGGPKTGTVLGVDLAARRKDPLDLIERMKAADPGVIPGFRFFFDHDARVLDHCLDDEDCAKVILTRAPLDSYVSRRIAAETDQWKLTNPKHRKTAAIRFDTAGFRQHLAEVEGFHRLLLRRLQEGGQTAFHIGYDDLQSLEVLNGLARFLGSRHRVDRLDRSLKKQNPAALRDKVENTDEMEAALAEVNLSGLWRIPALEPRRGPAIPTIVATEHAPLAFVPIKGAPRDRVLGWMAAQDGGDPGDLLQGFNQKGFRRWRRERPGYRLFTVTRHPLARAHDSFCRFILPPGAGAYGDLRRALRREFRLPLPKEGPAAPGYDRTAHREAFLGFLGFLKQNLENQTNLRIDPAWASQTAVIEGVSRVVPPAHVFGEDTLADSLVFLERQTGLAHHALREPEPGVAPFDLGSIYDSGLESAARDVYARDYLNFGYADWCAA